MFFLVLLGCAVGGWIIFWLVIRPFTKPLEQRIPTEARYRPSVVSGAQRGHESPLSSKRSRLPGRC